MASCVDPLKKGIEARLASANLGCRLHYANNPCIIHRPVMKWFLVKMHRAEECLFMEHGPWAWRRWILPAFPKWVALAAPAPTEREAPLLAHFRSVQKLLGHGLSCCASPREWAVCCTPALWCCAGRG